jgi:hypothetical protein
MNRRRALHGIGATAIVPFLPRLHPSLPPQEGEWKPRFLQAGEVETVAALADRIVPGTDTPGARQALVHQYIDFVLSTGDAFAAERFREKLRRLDRKCTEELGGPFATLPAARQDEFLTRLSKGEPFFDELKRLTVDGYYRSEAGMKQELGFEGNTFLSEFEGCKHPEHHEWKPDKAGDGARRAPPPRAGSEPSEERGEP